MIEQTSPVFEGTTIPKYGCLFISLLAAVEYRGDRAFTPAKVLKLHDDAIRLRYMDKNCYVLSPDGILRLGFAAMKLSGAMCQIGVRDDQGERFWNWVKVADRTADFIILKWKTPNGYHFTLGDKEGIELFDPHPNPHKLTLASVSLYHLFRET